MISKVLFTLQAGLRALRLHTKFVFIVLVLFLFPLLVLYISNTAATISEQNIETAEKEVITLLHKSLTATYKEGNVSFTETALDYKESMQVPIEAYLFAQNGFENEIIEKTASEDLFLKDYVFTVTPETGEIFIFEDFKNGRTWNAASKFTNGTSSFLLITTHDYSKLDLVFAARTNKLYWPVALGFLFLITIVYWLIRQINWEQKYETLKSAAEEEELLISTITHEFRAPLTAIRGYSSFLRESNRLRPKDVDSLENIEISTNRLLHLVNDFLEVAKLQSGNLPISATKVSISEVVYRVFGTLGSSAAEKKLILRDATQKKELTLITDAARLEQLLTNIVSNAIKYTKRGSVVITYEQNPLYLTIRVQDTGSGINADDQAKLFRPFSRVGGVENTEIVGSGLGMWITKKLTERLGGDIKVESIKDVGTHIVIKFDLRKIAAMTREGIL